MRDAACLETLSWQPLQPYSYVCMLCVLTIPSCVWLPPTPEKYIKKKSSNENKKKPSKFKEINIIKNLNTIPKIKPNNPVV